PFDHPDLLKRAVLASAHRHDAIVPSAVPRAVTVQNRLQVPFARSPVHGRPPLKAAAGIADPFRIDEQVRFRLGHDALATVSDHGSSPRKTDITTTSRN